MLRLLAQSLGPQRLDDHPVLHHRDPVADGVGQVEVVADEQHGEAARRPLLVEDRHDLLLGGDVERRRRLVGQQQRRLAGHRGHDHDALQEAAGELVGLLPHPTLGVTDADVLQDRARPRARRRHGCGRWTVDQVLDQEVADGAQRVDVCAGVLEDHS